MASHKEYIVTHLLQRFSTDKAHREEALREILALTELGKDEKATASLAAAIPALPASLYEKWAGMFADRLLETASSEQIEELCQPTDDNKATLTLLFSMFMESDRMEKQKVADLQALAVATAG